MEEDQEPLVEESVDNNRKRKRSSTVSQTSSTTENDEDHNDNKPSKEEGEESDSDTTCDDHNLTFPVTNVYKMVKNAKYGWLFHIAAVAITSCLKHCQRESIDIREDTDSIDWSHVASTSFTSSDIQKLWYFIGKQYPNESISNIMDLLSQFATVSRDDLEKEDLRIEYKHVIPKKPQSAFLLFYHKKRPKLAKKYPQMTYLTLTKKMGEYWRKMSSEEKGKYKQQYRENMEDYQQQLREFHFKYPEVPIKNVPKCFPLTEKEIDKLIEKKRFKELRKLVVPRRPNSGFIHFCKDQRTALQRKYPHIPPTKITAKLGIIWKKLTEEQKAKYVDQYHEEKEIYERQMKELCETYPKVAQVLKLIKTPPKKKERKKVKSANVLTTDEEEEQEVSEEEQEVEEVDSAEEGSEQQEVEEQEDDNNEQENGEEEDYRNNEQEAEETSCSEEEQYSEDDNSES